MCLRIWPVMSFILLTVAGCNIGSRLTIVGSGAAMVEGRDCEGFDRLKVSHSINAEVTVGEDFDVRISGDDNIVPLVETLVSDDRLRVRLPSNARIVCKTPLRVKVQMPTLRDVDASGSSTVTILGEVDVQSLEASGASKIVAGTLVSGDLDVDANGASRMTLAGTCDKVSVDVSGACSIDLKELGAASVSVDCSGASTVHAGASETISGDVSGASKVTYTGEAEIAVSKSGASTVKSRD